MDHLDKMEQAPGAARESDPQEITDYSVGYGKPPLIRRFKSGQSGNRRGRPRESKNRKTIVREIAYEMHTLVEDGQRRRRSTLELMLLAFRNQAATGKVRAFRAFQKYLAKFEPQDTNSNLGVLVVSAPMTFEETIAYAKKVNEEARARRYAKSMKNS